MSRLGSVLIDQAEGLEPRDGQVNNLRLAASRRLPAGMDPEGLLWPAEISSPESP